ncbi:DUF6233 domain-containing protein [Streptomyces niveus]|uniref:DUF6233 domain-containing protein n=1 Tax=Streptomyces niveus TaxID=193462 RepID=UPI00363AE530
MELNSGRAEVAAVIPQCGAAAEAIGDGGGLVRQLPHPVHRDPGGARRRMGPTRAEADRADWCLQYSVGGRAARPAILHASQCWVPGVSMEGISREQAVEALTSAGIPPCFLCRPENELGVLD